MSKNRKVLIAGMGVSGRAAAQLLAAKGIRFAVFDDKGGGYGDVEAYSSSTLPIEEFETVVVSPGIPASHPLVKQAKEAGLDVIGEIELACRFLPRENRLFGITGTNGKTTVTLLVSHILNSVGLNARAVGNVGTALSEAVIDCEKNALFVVELSSFQLETLKMAPFDAGVLLNLTEDHLDRHGSCENYLRAKLVLASSLKEGGDFYCDQNTFWKYRNLFEGIAVKTMGFQEGSTLFYSNGVINREGVAEAVLKRMPSGHHPVNILAAYALCSRAGVKEEEFVKGIESFVLPEHRIEFVLEDEGVSFYNDSKGTNVAAVVHAVSSIDGKISVIVGGVDKGGEYTPWIEKFTGKVKAIYAIGEAAPKISRQLKHIFPVHMCESLEEAVLQAHSGASPGESVLLSPGCSSFDMFENYKCRGIEFKKIVLGLKERRRIGS